MNVNFNKVKSYKMTKKEFTQKIAQGKFGVWTPAAKYALEKDEIDLYLGHWLEQDADSGSRPMVVRMLEGELYEALQTFKVDEEGICIKHCDKFPECEPCGSHFKNMESVEVWFVHTKENVVMRVCSSKQIATNFRDNAFAGYYSDCGVKRCTEYVKEWSAKIDDSIPLTINK